jgi:gluconolactonase
MTGAKSKAAATGLVATDIINDLLEGRRCFRLSCARSNCTHHSLTMNNQNSPSTASHTARSLLQPHLSRRNFLSSFPAFAAGAAVAPALAADRDWTGKNPVRYPDADIISLDPKFDKYKLGNTSIQRIYHNPAMLWAEGCAWNAVGRYLLWSDIPNDVQLRWIEDDGRTSIFRHPAGNSNGNTFDYEGRQLSCEHGNRRVVRYEHTGKITVLADKFEGKRLNAPNDIVVHPNDGAIWFTDPGYGSMMNYEGNKGPLDLKEAVYRIDAKTGKMDKVTDEMEKPNGLCFSPDYKKLYIADTGKPRDIQVFDVDGTKLKKRQQFVAMAMKKQSVDTRDGKREVGGNGGSDGIRCDVDGNVWSAAGWHGAGYDGVHVFTPEGQRIGMILLPEICSNLCFGGAKRNRLFMTASTSVYAVYVETQGAHIT